VKHPAARSPSFSVRGLIDLVHPVLASKLQLSVLVPLDGSLDRTQVLHPGLDFCRHTFWPPRLQFYVSEVSVGLILVSLNLALVFVCMNRFREVAV
jgi:hypothetical protein